MNRESSRSHLIMSIVIESTNLQTQNVTKGKLSFVDLAGSERCVFIRVCMDSPGATVLRVVEAQLGAEGTRMSVLLRVGLELFHDFDVCSADVSSSFTCACSNELSWTNEQGFAGFS